MKKRTGERERREAASHWRCTTYRCPRLVAEKDAPGTAADADAAVAIWRQRLAKYGAAQLAVAHALARRARTARAIGPIDEHSALVRRVRLGDQLHLCNGFGSN